MKHGIANKFSLGPPQSAPPQVRQRQQQKIKTFPSVLSFVKIQAASLPLTLLHAESCVAMATTSLVLCHSSLRFFTSERPPILHKVATIQWRSTVSFLPPSLSLSLCRNFEKLRFRPRRRSSPCVRVSRFFPRSGGPPSGKMWACDGGIFSLHLSHTH